MRVGREEGERKGGERERKKGGERERVGGSKEVEGERRAKRCLSTNLISLIKLSKLLHLVFLKSGGNLPHAMGEDVDDLVQNLEHGPGDDLQHLWNGTETGFTNGIKMCNRLVSRYRLAPDCVLHTSLAVL